MISVDPRVFRVREGAEDEALGQAFLCVLRQVKAADAQEFTLVTTSRRDLRHAGLVKLLGPQRIESLERHGVASVRGSRRVVHHSAATSATSAVHGIAWALFPTPDQLAQLIDAAGVTALVVSVDQWSAVELWLRRRGAGGRRLAGSLVPVAVGGGSSRGAPDRPA